MKRAGLLCGILCLIYCIGVFASGEVISLDFRNQKIRDIIYAIADISGETVFFDDTVEGSATFKFRDKDFESAINRFARANGLFVEKEGVVYNISRIKVQVTEDKRVNVEAEDVGAEIFLKILSRKTGITIMSDSFSKTNITIRMEGAKIIDVLKTVCYKLPGFEIEEINGGYYLYKASGQLSAKRSSDNFKITKDGDLYSINIKKALFTSVIEKLFTEGEREYVFYCKTGSVLENISYEDKEFDTLLTLLLSPLSCDFAKTDNVYSIYDVDKKTFMRGIKNTKVIKPVNMGAERLVALLPTDVMQGVTIKTDKRTNTIFLTGTQSETEQTEELINKIDSRISYGEYKRFDLKNINVEEIVSLIPKELLYSEVIVIPGSNSFVAEVNETNLAKMEEFINIADSKIGVYIITLKYIKAEDLFKNLPPSADKKKLYATGDSTRVYYSGTKEQYEAIKKELKEIDRPREQIRYQILVIQRQKSDAFNLNPSFKFSSNDDASKSGTYSYGVSLKNILSMNFDIISKFGMQFAATLNSEIDDGLSHVLADTTLNGLSGEKVKFSNTSTYRYRDIVIEGTTSRYTSTTREITSGLTLSVNGWVSGDNMITASIEAAVSKQSIAPSSSDDTTSPPSTTEKKVSTTVRCKSGEPVIIGGLLETETDLSESRTPVFGAIPGIGNLFKKQTRSRVDTEFVVYLVPFVEKYKRGARDVNANIERYAAKYAKG